MHTSRLAHMVLIAQSLLATAAAASGYEASPRIDAPGYCATPQVVVYYHQRTPYYEKQVDGLGGLVAGPIQQAMRNAGIDFSWQEVPAKRQLLMLMSSDEPRCAAGWFKTPDREMTFRYSEAIYQDRSTIAVARKDDDRLQDNIPVETLLRQKDLLLLRKAGYSYGQHLDMKLASDSPWQYVTVTDNLNMLRMLLKNRADYCFMAVEEAEALLAREPVFEESLKIIHFVDLPPGNTRHLICNRITPPALLERFDRELPDLSGRPDRLAAP